ncbi:hypothetical protein CTAYLR_005753 [Chrysophaeum taylorii]|uniref:Histone-binding protein RBBP4-like N-terminal domain-containing protein n=1 Tax=Chrysophaeum taylorii TaxID=2483200 RepID=A0AAD7XPC2_9STRA|nr:hypothetical protein CTAYLR_005753 [Chrysophaeum taylorii]
MATGEEKIEEEYKVWARNAPFLYDSASTKALEWPSLTVDWLPGSSSEGVETGWRRHQLILGTHTSDGSPNRVMLVTVDLPAVETQIDTRENFGEDTSAVVLAMDHPGGEVNRARHMPQRPTVFATKCADGGVYVYDIEATAAIEDVDGRGPTVRCVGHDDEGFGLEWNPRETGRLLSAAYDGKICLWDVGDLKTGSASVIIREAHSGGPVGDISWSPRSEAVFASGGDDGRVLLWDLRASDQKPSVVVREAHVADINCIAFPPLHDDESPYVSFLVATASADGAVKLWDQRKLDAPLHENRHDAEIVALHWAPFEETVLGAAGADRKVHVYDYAKIGAPAKEKPVAEEGAADGEEEEDDDDDDPPELVFKHGGHRAKINDFSWNKTEEFLAASVSADNAFQVWWVSDDAYVVDDDQPFASFNFFDLHHPTANGDAPPDAKRAKTD